MRRFLPLFGGRNLLEGSITFVKIGRPAASRISLGSLSLSLLLTPPLQERRSSLFPPTLHRSTTGWLTGWILLFILRTFPSSIHSLHGWMDRTFCSSIRPGLSVLVVSLGEVLWLVWWGLSRGAATSSTLRFFILCYFISSIHALDGLAGHCIPFVWLNCSCLLCSAWDTWPSFFCRGELVLMSWIKSGQIIRWCVSHPLGILFIHPFVCFFVTRMDGWIDR